MGKNWKDKDWDKIEKTPGDEKLKKRAKSSPPEGSKFEITSTKINSMLGESGYFKAIVVEVHKRYAFVSPVDKMKNVRTDQVWLATVAKKFLQVKRVERNFVAVGDVVCCQKNCDDLAEVSKDIPSCTIEGRAVRENKISRISPLRTDLSHVIAANVDQLVIVASLLDPKVKWGLIDRYLVLAEVERIAPLIILTKKDLFDSCGNPGFKERCLKHVNVYQNLGYRVELLQTNISPESQSPFIFLLKSLFENKLSLISGHSGVGKSSVVNLLEPEINQDVEKDEIFYKGRHTTTYSSLIRLGVGGYVVDTPGVRSFLVDHKNKFDLDYCFKEMRPYIGGCKFRECKHVDELGCIVREAVFNGDIAEWRYRSYLNILLGSSGREGRLRDIEVEP